MKLNITQDWLKKQLKKEDALKVNEPHACNCIGPQGDDPVCPCQMRCTTVQNGRRVIVRDLGPA